MGTTKTKAQTIIAYQIIGNYYYYNGRNPWGREDGPLTQHAAGINFGELSPAYFDSAEAADLFLTKHMGVRLSKSGKFYCSRGIWEDDGNEYARPDYEIEKVEVPQGVKVHTLKQVGGWRVY